MIDDKDEIGYERTQFTILNSLKTFHRAKWAATASMGAGIVLMLLSIGLMMNIPFNSLDGAQTSIMIMIGAIIMGLGCWLPITNGSLILDVLIRGKQKKQDLLNIQSKLVRRAYLMNLEIVNVKGISRTGKIVRHLTLVFPEVKEEVDKYIIKRRKNVDDIPSGWGAKFRKLLLIFSSDYDVVMNTTIGFYLIKFFDKKVTFDDIEKMVKSLNRRQTGVKIMGSQKIVRVICLAKSYDEFFETTEFVDEIQKLKRSFYLDLILEEDPNGYATVWID